MAEVGTRKKKRKRKKKNTGGENKGNPRVPAPRAQKKRPAVNSVVITPGQGMTYAQILKDTPQNVNPDEAEVTIHNFRKTANGNVLVAFKSSTMSGKASQEAVQGVVEVEGTCELDTHVIVPSPRSQMTALVNTDPCRSMQLEPGVLSLREG